MNTVGLLHRFGLGQSPDLLAFLQTTLILEDVDSLEALQHVALLADLTASLETLMQRHDNTSSATMFNPSGKAGCSAEIGLCSQAKNAYCSPAREEIKGREVVDGGACADSPGASTAEAVFASLNRDCRRYREPRPFQRVCMVSGPGDGSGR